MYATTKELKKTKRARLGSIHAAAKIKMASRLANRLKSLSPYVDEKVFRSLQKRLENIPLSERRSQKIQASKGRFFVICLLNSTADRGALMLGERPRLLVENASKRFYRSSGQWVRISIQWAWSRIQILCSANWLGLLMFFMFLGVDYLLKQDVMYRSNRSFNMPPPGNHPGIWLFWKLLFKFPPTQAKMPFKCPTLGSIQVIKCPYPGDISQAQKWRKNGGNTFSCRTKSI